MRGLLTFPVHSISNCARMFAVKDNSVRELSQPFEIVDISASLRKCQRHLLGIRKTSLSVIPNLQGVSKVIIKLDWKIHSEIKFSKCVDIPKTPIFISLPSTHYMHVQCFYHESDWTSSPSGFVIYKPFYVKAKRDFGVI